MHWAECRLSLLVLFLGLGFLSSSVSMAAQDLPLETYTSDETDLSFQYPAGWLIQEVGVNDIYIGNSADAMNQIASPATPYAPDTVLVQLSFDMGPVTPGVVWRPIDVLGAMTGTLAEQIPDATIGEPETVTVAGNEAARLKVTSSGAQLELLFYVVQTGETLTLVTVSSALGEMSEFADEVLAILGSISTTPGNNGPVPIQSTAPAATPTSTSVKGASTTPTAVLARTGSIAYEETVAGNLASDDGDRWTFVGEAGDLVTIRMTAEFDNYLELYGPTGELLEQDDDSGGNLNAYIEPFALPESGEYTIVTRSYVPSVGGPYSLELRQPSLVTSGPLQVGDVINSYLTDRDDEWTFEAAEGDLVTVLLVGAFDTVLELYGPDDTLIARSDDTITNAVSYVENVVLPSEGEYTIRVGSYGDSGQGNYLLSVGHPPSQVPR